MTSLSPRLPILYISYISFICTFIGLLTGCRVAVSPYTCNNMPESLKNLPTTTEYMYTLWRHPETSLKDFNENLIAANPFAPVDDSTLQGGLWEQFDLDEIKFSVIDDDVKAPLLKRRKRLEDGALLSAVVSVSTHRGEAERVADYLATKVHFVAGYEVERAVPVEYDRQWPGNPPQARSEGLQLVSIFAKRNDLNDQTFLALWQCSDTPFAIDIHPHWRYERNQVIRPITENAPHINAIVGLHAKQDSDITHLHTFFGKDLRNSLRVNANVKRFIDMDSLNVNTMREWILRSDNFGVTPPHYETSNAPHMGK